LLPVCGFSTARLHAKKTPAFLPLMFSALLKNDLIYGEGLPA